MVPTNNREQDRRHLPATGVHCRRQAHKALGSPLRQARSTPVAETSQVRDENKIEGGGVGQAKDYTMYILEFTARTLAGKETPRKKRISFKLPGPK